MKYQEQFYEATDINSSCFVFASAGSGKTKILVDRYIKSMFFGAKPREILCITFTNAAVFEMESRISKILERLYLNENNFTEEYLNNAIGLPKVAQKDIENAEGLFFKFQDELSNHKILTIHSFCQNLLKNFPMESEILPNFKILDEMDGLKLIQKAKRNIFKKIVENSNEHVLNSLASLISVYSFEDFTNRIFSSSSKFLQFFDINYDLEVYKESLFKKFDKKVHLNFSKEQQNFLDTLVYENIEDLFLTKTGTIRKKLPFSENKTASEIADILFENNQTIKKESVVEKTYVFLKIAKMIFDEFQNLKKEQNVIDFSDVLHKTEYLLTKSCAKEFVISQIGKNIKYVMIDEAQDISSIQWRLIYLFCDDIFCDPHEDKTIFVVGDIKQSIYRFQDANHKIFIKFYEHCKLSLQELGKNFKTVHLNTCYRTLPKILKNVDFVFEKMANFAFDQNYIDYKKHIPFRKSPDGEFELIETTDSENSVKEIANYIKNLNIEKGLILTRSRNDISEYLMEELDSLGIRVSPPDRIKLSDNLLIMDILALADIAVDNKNDYSLACILKSPYIFEYPCDNNDLFGLCYNRTNSVFDNLKAINKNKFEYLVSITSCYNPDNLVEFFFYIISNVIRKTSNSDDYIMSAFMDNVIKFSSTKSDNIREFLDYFRKSKIEISVQNSNQNVMTLSTIHGAKGLESQNVFLLDFDLFANKSKTKFIWHDNGELFSKNSKEEFLFLIKPSQKDSFAEIEAIIEYEYIEEEKELLRLLYVAMTRARDKLYVFGSSCGKTAFNLIKSSLTNKLDINNE